MGASFSSSVGGAEERLEESESSMVVVVALFLNSGQRDATSEGARLNSRQVWGKLMGKLAVMWSMRICAASITCIYQTTQACFLRQYSISCLVIESGKPAQLDV